MPIPGESEYFRIGIFLTDGTEEDTGAAEDAEGGLDGTVCAEGAGGGLDGDVWSLDPIPGIIKTFSRGPTTHKYITNLLKCKSAKIEDFLNFESLKLSPLHIFAFN